MNFLDVMPSGLRDAHGTGACVCVCAAVEILGLLYISTLGTQII